MKSPVFICGHRKSGTTLLRNLLDGHSKLSVSPNDLGLLFLYFPNYIIHEDNISKLQKRLDQVLFLNHEDSCKKSIPVGKHKYFDRWRQSFLDEVSVATINQLKDKCFLLNLYNRTFQKFYSNLNDKSHSPKTTIFKETMIEINALSIADEIPGARFIHIIRDPKANYASLKSGVEGYYKPLGGDNNNTILMSLLHRLQLSMGMAKINESSIGKKSYLVVKYEDIVHAPRTTLNRISDWLEVEFEESLLIPSLFSNPTCSNNFTGEKSYSISDTGLDKWKKILTKEEILIIDFFLGGYMSEYGYDFNKPSREMAVASGKFYEWSNYEYFFKDFYS
jgi:hypothetical protein